MVDIYIIEIYIGYREYLKPDPKGRIEGISLVYYILRGITYTTGLRIRRGSSI